MDYCKQILSFRKYHKKISYYAGSAKTDNNRHVTPKKRIQMNRFAENNGQIPGQAAKSVNIRRTCRPRRQHHNSFRYKSSEIVMPFLFFSARQLNRFMPGIRVFFCFKISAQRVWMLVWKWGLNRQGSIKMKLCPIFGYGPSASKKDEAW